MGWYVPTLVDVLMILIISSCSSHAGALCSKETQNACTEYNESERKMLLMRTCKTQKRWLLIPSLLTISCILLILTACGGGQQAQTQASPTQTPQVDWKLVDQAIGRAGTDLPGGVHRYSLPRTDLTVTLQGVQLKAGFALGGFAAFEPMGNAAMAMGDLVLTEDEINPVISELQQGGIGQTALHNHLLFETPHVMYLHFGGQGDPVQLARVLHSALALTKTPLTAPSPSQPSPVDLDTAQLDTILGYHGKANNGIYQYSIPRAEKITTQGMEIPPAMGVATALNFQPTGNGNAAITGDFTLIAKEVPAVLQTLREQGIAVTALHSHMLDDSPHLFYIHFWANENAIKLAHGLRAVLDQTNSAKANT